MIKLDVENKKITNEVGDLLSNNEILSYINKKLIIDECSNLSLLSLIDLISEYENLFLVFPELRTLKANMEEIIRLNEEKSIDGTIQISERYLIKPLLKDNDYGEESTSYLDINKHYAIYYVNTKNERMELEKVPLKNVMCTSIFVSDKENFFINMYNNSSVIVQGGSKITLNNFLRIISEIDFVI